MKPWSLLATALVTMGLLAAVGRDKGPENVVPLAEGTSTEEIALGPASDPEIRDLLDEYGAYLRRQGVNTAWFTPEELTLLRRRGVHAIPPRHLWDEMARTIVGVAQPIREELGAPLRIYNGFRPRWYNVAVGGAKNSLHIRNAALDLIPENYNDRERLALIAARFAKDFGDELKLGMGIYNYPAMTGLHVDALVRSRFTPYASTKQWMSVA